MKSFGTFLGHLTGTIPSAKPTEVNDAFFRSHETLKVSKIAKPIKHEVATKAGVIDTLENPIPHPAGHHIITGPKGEKYPVDPETFGKLYTDHGDGTATPKPIMKTARPAVGTGTVNTTWGEKMKYKQGEDMIVRHGKGDYGVVKNDIFAQTYKVHK